MTSEEERAYEQGRQRAYLDMLSTALRGLGRDVAPEGAAAVAQFVETRLALRRLCEELGCNDWPDELHLADVVDKYVGRSLDEGPTWHDKPNVPGWWIADSGSEGFPEFFDAVQIEDGWTSVLADRWYGPIILPEAGTAHEL